MNPALRDALIATVHAFAGDPPHWQDKPYCERFVDAMLIASADLDRLRAVERAAREYVASRGWDPNEEAWLQGAAAPGYRLVAALGDRAAEEGRPLDVDRALSVAELSMREAYVSEAKAKRVLETMRAALGDRAAEGPWTCVACGAPVPDGERHADCPADRSADEGPPDAPWQRTGDAEYDGPDNTAGGHEHWGQ